MDTSVSISIEELSKMESICNDMVTLAGAIFVVLLIFIVFVAAVFGLIYLIRYIIRNWFF